MKIISGLIGLVLALSLLGFNWFVAKRIWSYVASSFSIRSNFKYFILMFIFLAIYLAIGILVTITWFSSLRSVGLGAGIFVIIVPLFWPFFVILTMVNIADNKQIENSYKKKPNEVYEYKMQNCPEGYEKICELYYSKIILKRSMDIPFAYNLLLKEIEKDNADFLPDIVDYLAGEAKLDDIKPFIGPSASAGQNYAGAYILQSLIIYILNTENGTTVSKRAFRSGQHNKMVKEYLKYTIEGYRNSSTEVNSISPWDMASLYSTYYNYLPDGAEKQVYLIEASEIYKQLLNSTPLREELYQGLYKYLSLQNSMEEVLDVLKNLNKKAVNLEGYDRGFKRRSLIVEQYSYSYGSWHKAEAYGYFYYRHLDEPVRMLDISLPDFHPFYTVEVFEKLIDIIEDKDIRIKAAPYLLEAVYLGDKSEYTASIFEEAMQKRYKQDNEPRWLDLINIFKMLASENYKKAYES